MRLIPHDLLSPNPTFGALTVFIGVYVQWKSSVAYRLAVLVAVQGLIIAAVVCLGSWALKSIGFDASQMYSFHLVSVAEVGKALETTIQLQELMPKDGVMTNLRPLERERSTQLVKSLVDFYFRYLTQWSVAYSDSIDAGAFRSDVRAAGKDHLLGEEQSALALLRTSFVDFRKAIESDASPRIESHWNRVGLIRNNLAKLLAINVELAKVSNDRVRKRELQARLRMITIGSLGIILALLLGIVVQRGIAPRISLLVEKVRVFKDTGVNAKVPLAGTDEIAVLGRALDAGFDAISQRERDRDRFLSIAAHELKTPVTSIQGYATLLTAEGTTHEAQAQALDVISRQAWRLARLIEGLFLMVRSRQGTLKFSPTPFDFSILIERVAQEIRPMIGGRSFVMEVASHVRIVGDQALLDHAVGSILTSAAAIFGKSPAILVRLTTGAGLVCLTVEAAGAVLPVEDVEDLFIPFREVEFENGSGARGTVGLYISREIARLHGGRLYATTSPAEVAAFHLELPI